MRYVGLVLSVIAVLAGWSMAKEAAIEKYVAWDVRRLVITEQLQLNETSTPLVTGVARIRAEQEFAQIDPLSRGFLVFGLLVFGDDFLNSVQEYVESSSIKERQRGGEPIPPPGDTPPPAHKSDMPSPADVQRGGVACKALIGISTPKIGDDGLKHSTVTCLNAGSPVMTMTWRDGTWSLDSRNAQAPAPAPPPPEYPPVPCPPPFNCK